MSGRKRLEAWLEGLHRRVLGTAMGERTRAVASGLAWTTPLGVAARASGLVTTLVVARLLGPGEYGEANVALAVALWVQVPMVLGLPLAVMHHLPRARDDEERDRWATTGLALFLSTGAATLAAGFAFLPSWATLADVPREAVALALAWSAGYGLHVAATSLLAARERFRARAAVDGAQAFLLPSLVVALWPADALAQAATGLGGLVAAWPRRPSFAGWRARAESLLALALLGSLGGLGHALLQGTGRLVVNRHLELEEVGQLSAYQDGSLRFAMVLLAFVTQVFFPVASRTPNREVLRGKLLRALALATLPAFFGFALILLTWMSLLGTGYSLRAWPVAVFAAASAAAVAQGLVSWFLASEGRSGAAAAAACTVGAGAVHAVAALALVPHLGVLGVGLALLAGHAAGLGAIWIPAFRRWGRC